MTFIVGIFAIGQDDDLFQHLSLNFVLLDFAVDNSSRQQVAASIKRSDIEPY